MSYVCTHIYIYTTEHSKGLIAARPPHCRQRLRYGLRFQAARTRTHNSVSVYNITKQRERERERASERARERERKREREKEREREGVRERGRDR